MLSVEAIDELRALADLLRDHAGDEVGYGFFPGGNPNDFSPDDECSTEEERTAWADACKRWDAGDRNVPSDQCGFMERLQGPRPKSGFGLGTYTMRRSDVDELATELDRWIDKAREIGDRHR